MKYMRIVVADYSGHPFQVQLSRELSRRGHSVLHLYFAEFQTPKGRLSVGRDDPATLEIEPISLGMPFAKQNFIKRRSQEIAIGKKFESRISFFGPDVVVASNLPLDSLRIVANSAKTEKRAFVFWQQDIYSIAIDRILRDRWGLVGALIGKVYKSIERNVLRRSEAVIAISDDFLPYLRTEFDVSGDHIHVVENWAPLDEITPRPKDNPWARANGLADKDVVLYSGTLGMKHDPGQILAVAESLRDRPNTEVVVVSEGPAAAWLAQKARELQLRCLRVMRFQPFEVYSDALASADVLISILEASSGAFSVPSKILSYLCAGRAIVLSAPSENLASRIVERSNAGLVVPAGDNIAFTNAIRAFLDNPEQRKRAGQCGIVYSQGTFDIRAIGHRFEAILLATHHREANRGYMALMHDFDSNTSVRPENNTDTSEVAAQENPTSLGV
ncbi:MAG TPA: glycosyltransferase family 4 protein [Verrucomicrobiae bacterium]|nr:glycosyltransferase family 4 protein [Verrucomicrobiae bacterium]